MLVRANAARLLAEVGTRSCLGGAAWHRLLSADGAGDSERVRRASSTRRGRL